LEGYRWSSDGFYAGRRKAPEWLDLSWLKYYGRRQSEQFREYRRGISRAFFEEIECPWNSLQQGLILGGEEFSEKIKMKMKKNPREEEKRWLIHDHQRSRNERIHNLIKKEKNPKVQIWLRIRMGHEQMSKVARELGYRRESAIYQMLTRLEESSRQDSKLLGKLRVYEEKCGEW